MPIHTLAPERPQTSLHYSGASGTLCDRVSNEYASQYSISLLEGIASVMSSGRLQHRVTSSETPTWRLLQALLPIRGM